MAGPNGPSMKDVADRAGVSLGTVSNVLNRPDVVSERTRRKVQTAIEDLGFVRNEFARQLAGTSSRTLAFVVFDMSNPYFTDVAQGAQAAADAAGLALYLCNSGEDLARQNAYLDLLEQQRVEGVLITPVDPADARLAALAAPRHPGGRCRPRPGPRLQLCHGRRRPRWRPRRHPPPRQRAPAHRLRRQGVGLRSRRRPACRRAACRRPRGRGTAHRAGDRQDRRRRRGARRRGRSRACGCVPRRGRAAASSARRAPS